MGSERYSCSVTAICSQSSSRSQSRGRFPAALDLHFSCSCLLQNAQNKQLASHIVVVLSVPRNAVQHGALLPACVNDGTRRHLRFLCLADLMRVHTTLS